MTSDRRFFSGDSLAQALNQAAQHFQMLPSEIEYKLVEKRHGFLKVRRKVVIEVDGADPGRAPAPAAAASPPSVPAPTPSAGPSSSPQDSAPEASAGVSPPAPPISSPAPPISSPEQPKPERAETRSPKPRPGRRPRGSHRESVGASLQEPGMDEIELPAAPLPAKRRFPVARGEEAEAAGKALALILDLAGLDLECEILQGEEELRVELSGTDQDILLRDRGRLLLAIQHLLPRAIRGVLGRSVVCRVDSDDFHMIREERLRDLAQRAADEVRHRGRPKTLEPMSPDERRIVHLTLADYPGVETESHGSGLFKRVMVRISRGETPNGSGQSR